jgi:hypothetical protein
MDLPATAIHMTQRGVEEFMHEDSKLLRNRVGRHERRVENEPPTVRRRSFHLISADRFRKQGERSEKRRRHSVGGK